MRDTRTEIVEAADMLFYQHGFDHTSSTEHRHLRGSPEGLSNPSRGKGYALLIVA